MIRKKLEALALACMLAAASSGLAACGEEISDASSTAAEKEAEEEAEIEAEEEIGMDEPVIDGTEIYEFYEDTETAETGDEAAEDTADVETAGTDTESADAAEGEYTYDADTHEVHYEFRNDRLLEQHYEKHGIEMGFDSEEDYEEAACEVIHNPEALTKTEQEDGDYVYYVEDTNEFVILSTDGYIRTYFNPSSGISYYNRQ